MTKREVKSAAKAAGLGLGFFLLIYYFFRKTRTIPELNPVTIRWEGQ